MHCQKCRTPLRLDGSLEELNPAAYDLLIGISSQQHGKNIHPSRPIYPQERKALYDAVSQNASIPAFKRNPTPSALDGNPRTQYEAARTGLRDNAAMSFVMLTESQLVPHGAATHNQHHAYARDGQLGPDGLDGESKAMSREMERVTKLFEILSARSDIDHPICVECTDLLVDGLQKRLEAATKERDAYIGFLKHLNAEAPTEDEIRESKAALERAQKAEEQALKELVELEKEKADVDEEIARLEEEARALDIEEEKFWRSRNSFATKLAEFQDERDSVNLKYDHDSQQLEKLQRTNVYNDTFCISHDGTFGTINGLRLGRLSNVPVEWSEINAAWGHATLLLATVADQLGFKFDGYELQPMGSTSRIVKIENPSPSNSRSGLGRRGHEPSRKVLELFSSGDMILGLTFMHGRFDRAMVAFLECLRQLGDFVQRETKRTSEHGRGLELPYTIHDGMIGEVSIRLGLAQDDSWSKACKYTLTCCKFLLAHASNLNTERRRT